MDRDSSCLLTASLPQIVCTHRAKHTVVLASQLCCRLFVAQLVCVRISLLNMRCRVILSVLCLLAVVVVDGAPASNDRTRRPRRKNNMRVTEPPATVSPVYPPFTRCDNHICDLRTHYCDKVHLTYRCLGKTTESDRQPNPNGSPFCMEWKQIVYFWWRSDMVVFPKSQYIVFDLLVSLLLL